MTDDVLGQLGLSLELEQGDIVTDAIVIMKVLKPDGDVTGGNSRDRRDRLGDPARPDRRQRGHGEQRLRHRRVTGSEGFRRADKAEAQQLGTGFDSPRLHENDNSKKGGPTVGDIGRPLKQPNRIYEPIPEAEPVPEPEPVLPEPVKTPA